MQGAPSTAERLYLVTNNGLWTGAEHDRRSVLRRAKGQKVSAAARPRPKNASLGAQQLRACAELSKVRLIPHLLVSMVATSDSDTWCTIWARSCGDLHGGLLPLSIQPARSGVAGHGQARLCTQVKLSPAPIPHDGVRGEYSGSAGKT